MPNYECRNGHSVGMEAWEQPSKAICRRCGQRVITSDDQPDLDDLRGYTEKEIDE